MQTISTLEELRNIYDAAVSGALTKVADHLTPLYQRWIGAARFTVLTTVGAAGTDASPRGDTGPVTHIASDQTLWLPDWRGNNRLDSLENIVTDGRVSLLFMVPGNNNVVRVNGTATLTADPAITGHFSANGKQPKTVIVVQVKEAYFQCAKALMRSKLWDPVAAQPDIPSAGDFLQEVSAGFDGKAYDEGYADYAKDRMW
ncbi:MAG: pyridoxamine 5'-phosphate oxidase family protein [Pseudomonadales bacterium]